MKKNISFLRITNILFLCFLIFGCNNPSEKHLALESAQKSLDENLQMYEMVWEKVFNERNLDMINEDYFTQDVVALATSSGDVKGLENFKAHYANYVTGFSDGKLTFVDLFGQGDKMVKHWRFTGTHDGEFFGVPPTGKKVDVSGTTLIEMKNGKIAAEQDTMDYLSFYKQLGLM